MVVWFAVETGPSRRRMPGHIPFTAASLFDMLVTHASSWEDRT